MFPYAVLTTAPGDTNAVRRRPRAAPGWHVAAMACLLIALPLTGGTAAWAAEHARFVPEASTATWEGDTVTVAFREVGVEPGTTSTIAVRASGTVETVCRQDDAVLISTSSSASATEVSDHLADATGTITGVRELTLAVRPPTIIGLDCATTVVRTLTVVVHDLDTGATLVLPTPTPSNDDSAASSPPTPTPRSE